MTPQDRDKLFRIDRRLVPNPEYSRVLCQHEREACLRQAASNRAAGLINAAEELMEIAEHWRLRLLAWDDTHLRTEAMK